MRAVIQRTKKASVTINNQVVAKIEQGILILIGIESSDNQEDIDWLSKKIVNLRIFPDEEKKMNLSVKQANANIIIVSQFTLFASTQKGNRPSFTKAAKPETAIPIYKNFIIQIEKELEKKVQTGVFGANMDVELINDGPVTIIIDTKNKQ